MVEQPEDLVDLVDGFVRLVERSFADVRFAGSGGEVDLNRTIPAVTMVRFELPRTEFLHLSSVIIDADGLDDPVRQTTRTMSSVWKDYDTVLEQGAIFDPEHRDKGFHTHKESFPWLEIGFDRPRDLSRIWFRNCEGPNSLRGRGIIVGVRTADGRYRTVYDGVAREREFIAAAESYANEFQPGKPQPSKGRQSKPQRSKGPELVEGLMSRARSRWSSFGARVSRPGASTNSGSASGSVTPAGVPELVKIMTMVALQDDTPVRWALERVELEPEQRARFRSEVNRAMLFEREREWTSHGVRRSFRFWSEQQKQDYLGFALEVIEALRELTPNVCFGFGSALAVVRDHELIPHDDDLDVLIGFEPQQAATHAEGRKLIRDCLAAKGFRITGGMTAYQWVTRSTGGTRLDVFIGVFEGPTISWYPGKRGALTRTMMFPAADRDFRGRSCPVPAQPESYLEQIYGSGWTSSDPNFKHTWEPAQYADLAGS